jgi:hypothetical protein
MSETDYRIIRKGSSRTIERDGDAEGDYATKEAAFAATVGAASNAIKNGLRVRISVPERAPGESSIGSRS